ncbi:hypothetical protein [Ralstonia sp. UBA689]|uniref:hypothetical protein n=1 Tax=Ralstonia sp. UBA689 TaxID=1947373 RepID=UPI0025E84E5D|nr:hypothetical protein [Ralstonia sp. UBA689]
MGVDDTSQIAMPMQIRLDALQQSSWLGDAFHQARIISSGTALDADFSGFAPASYEECGSANPVPA